MKILYVLNSSKFGGMEVHVLDLVKGMIKKGHDVFVWCPVGEMSDLYQKNGAVVSNELISKDFDFKYIKKLKKFVESQGIDIVHSHELKAVVNSLLACRNTKVKAVVTHTHTPISEWQINPLKKLLDVKLYSYVVNRLSSAEIALTESKKKVKMKEGIKEKILEVIPNGLDTSIFNIPPLHRFEFEKEIKRRHGIPEDAFVFGNLGRVTQEKGHEVLVRAFSKFLNSQLFRKEKLFLLIVGGGALEEKIKNLVNELGLDKNVVITGRFNDEDKIKYLSTFDVFVFPTLAEGFGIVLIEAMSMGLPVICSNLEVLREVGGSYINLFNVGDYNDLSDKMVDEYNKIGGENKNLVEGAREFVENNYSLESFVDKYDYLYLKLLGDKK